MAESVQTHDEEITTRRPLVAMAVVRAILTLAGAVALVIAMFQVWIHGALGDTLAFNAYWRTNPATDVNFSRGRARAARLRDPRGDRSDDDQRLDHASRWRDRDHRVRADRG
jgi:hypothetical protein